MTSLEGALARISQDLDAVGRPWALIGALAVAARAEARATLDVDVALATQGSADATEVVSEMRRRGYQWAADFGGAMTSLSVPGSTPPGLRLDLLFSLTGIEDEVARSGERLEVLPGLILPVARSGDLIALKLLAAGQPGREHDRRDLRALIAAATPGDVDRARTLIALLVARGSVGTESLVADLDALCASL